MPHIACIVPDFKVYILGFARSDEMLIRAGIAKWGDFVGPERFAGYVERSANAQGRGTYLISVGKPDTGGLHFGGPASARIELGDKVFAPNNWANLFRPDPVYKHHDISVRITLEHELGHAIFESDESPVESFAKAWNPNNRDHLTICNADCDPEEPLGNILAYMVEEGTDAPGIPKDLQVYVAAYIVPYLRGISPSPFPPSPDSTYLPQPLRGAFR